MATRSYRRITLACALAALLLLAPPAVSGGFVWDIGIAFGYLCAALLVCLYIFPLRGDGLPHSRLLGMSQHRLVGWLMLGVAAAHVTLLLASQPLVVRYLLPSAPVFMWCGVAGLLLVAILVQTGLAARAALRRSSGTGIRSPTSSTLHVVLAGLFAAVLAAHILGSGQLASGAKTFVLIALLALPLGWFAGRRRSTRSPPDVSRRATTAAACVLIIFLPSSSANRALLEPVSRPAPIHLRFPHEMHVAVNCIECHHNFVDGSGVSSCIDCHRSARTDLDRSSESTFHVFCRNCHARAAVEGSKHGPTRSCSACHRD